MTRFAVCLVLVSVACSPGPPPPVVPDVIGLRQGEARDILDAAGIDVHVSTTLGQPGEEPLARDDPSLWVLEVQPREGERADRVALTLVSGDEARPLITPDVRGLREGPARARLERAGLVGALDPVDTLGPEGSDPRSMRVTSQMPGPFEVAQDGDAYWILLEPHPDD